MSFFFDYKGDYNESKENFVKATNAKVLKPYHLPYNPLALTQPRVFKPLLPIHVANTFNDTLSRVYHLGPKQSTLSKGETQVFVMSLYWAMMQQCKCELPFIIDTPFARIDTDHRANIVEQFFKRLPGQLFVLSTNEEIGSKHMLALHDQTSNIFLLEYGDDKCTHIMNNQYFEV